MYVVLDIHRAVTKLESKQTLTYNCDPGILKLILYYDLLLSLVIMCIILMALSVI